MAENYFPAKRANIQTWIAVLAFLVSIASAVFTFGALFERVDNIEAVLEKHGRIASHGIVSERLTLHDTQIKGQERSLKTVDEANERLAEKIHELETDLRVLERRVEYQLYPGIDP